MSWSLGLSGKAEDVRTELADVARAVTALQAAIFNDEGLVAVGAVGSLGTEPSASVTRSTVVDLRPAAATPVADETEPVAETPAEEAAEPEAPAEPATEPDPAWAAPEPPAAPALAPVEGNADPSAASAASDTPTA